MIKEYKTVDGLFENTIVIEKSRFICHIKGINDEDDAKEFIASVRKENSLANHNCYAYIADELALNQKFSDDGEPQGTAGIPMLEVLKKSGLKKVCAVCTRFFGGIKLGAGGLVRAYGGSLSEVIKLSKVVDYKMSEFFTMNCSYDKYSVLQKILAKENVTVLDNEFSDNVKIKAVLPCDRFEKFSLGLIDLFNGENLISRDKSDYYKFRSENAENY